MTAKFEPHPRFQNVAEYARWFVRTYPAEAPEWVKRIADEDRRG